MKINEHYNLYDYQAWDFIADAEIDFFLGNVVKYLARYPYKNQSIEDLEKALDYFTHPACRVLSPEKWVYKQPYINKFIEQFADGQRLLLIEALSPLANKETFKDLIYKELALYGVNK